MNINKIAFFSGIPFVEILFTLLIFTWPTQGSAKMELTSEGKTALEEARKANENQAWQILASSTLIVLKEDPTHLEANALLGLAELHHGFIEKAVKRLIWVNTLNPGNALFRLALGQALLAAGDRKQALEHAKYAAQLAPNDQHCLSFLAQLQKNDTAVKPTVASTMKSPTSNASAPNSTLAFPPTQQKKSGSGKNSTPVASKKSQLLSKPLLASEPALASKPTLASKSVSLPNPIIDKAELSEIEKEMAKIESACKAEPQHDLEIIIKAIRANPDLLAAPDLGQFRRRTETPRPKLRDEIFRQFLQWKIGDLGQAEFGSWLASNPTIGELFRKDSALSDLTLLLGQGAISLTFMDPPPQKKISDDDWTASLEEAARIMLLNGHYKEAWQIHLATNSSHTPEWHYLTSRLALEIWQFRDSTDNWLKIAGDHLGQCISEGKWQEDSRILLMEIKSRLGTESSL
ncbi:MAG: hypothetical protein HQM08_16125 [Candidatus Riflebacteria bacterium]|nr:hypothetical protein [Candidatus Riflebacteria bacterium]